LSETLTVLVVDDEAAVRNLLKQFLEDTYSIVLANNGQEAWEKIQHLDGGVDILLSDIHMPLMDGVSLLQNVRNSYPDICIIMMSGASDVRTAIQAIRHGAYDYISKPIRELEEVSILIQRWVQQQSLETKLQQYAELHNDIMQNLKIRSFLAIDVVGSKAMKNGENPLIIHHSFLVYHRHIESIVLKNGGQIHSTAGDGVMACFLFPMAAITAAREALESLESFNQHRNKLQREFKLRMGIHTGSVVIEKSGRVNEMYSEALDLTGHIQKSANVNSIEISDASIESIPDASMFTKLNKDVGGLSIFSVERK